MPCRCTGWRSRPPERLAPWWPTAGRRAAGSSAGTTRRAYGVAADGPEAVGPAAALLARRTGRRTRPSSPGVSEEKSSEWSTPAVRPSAASSFAPSSAAARVEVSTRGSPSTRSCRPASSAIVPPPCRRWARASRGARGVVPWGRASPSDSGAGVGRAPTAARRALVGAVAPRSPRLAGRGGVGGRRRRRRGRAGALATGCGVAAELDEREHDARPRSSASTAPTMPDRHPPARRAAAIRVADRGAAAQAPLLIGRERRRRSAGRRAARSRAAGVATSVMPGGRWVAASRAARGGLVARRSAGSGFAAAACRASPAAAGVVGRLVGRLSAGRLPPACGRRAGRVSRAVGVGLAAVGASASRLASASLGGSACGAPPAARRSPPLRARAAAASRGRLRPGRAAARRRSARRCACSSPHAGAGAADARLAEHGLGARRRRARPRARAARCRARRAAATFASTQRCSSSCSPPAVRDLVDEAAEVAQQQLARAAQEARAPARAAARGAGGSGRRRRRSRPSATAGRSRRPRAGAARRCGCGLAAGPGGGLSAGADRWAAGVRRLGGRRQSRPVSSAARAGV